MIRTPFGISAVVLSSAWYSGDILASEKAKQLELHMEKVAAHRPVPQKVTAELIDHSDGIDGIEMEWVTKL
jgi:hypothetical protein